MRAGAGPQIFSTRDTRVLICSEKLRPLGLHMLTAGIQLFAVCLSETSPWKTAEVRAYFEKHRNSLMPRSFLEAKFGVHNEKLGHFRIKKC